VEDKEITGQPAPDEEQDVEGHGPHKNAPHKNAPEAAREDDDDVEAHVHLAAPRKNAPRKN
jgi:hypothetical protein